MVQDGKDACLSISAAPFSAKQSAVGIATAAGWVASLHFHFLLVDSWFSQAECAGDLWCQPLQKEKLYKISDSERISEN